LYRAYNDRKTVCTNHQWTAVAVLYILVLWYYQVSQYLSHHINSFVAQHNTTLYYFLFYVRCQDMCLHGYGIATVHRQCKVLFIYPLINLSSKKSMQN